MPISDIWERPLHLTYQNHHFFLGISWHDSLLAGPIPIPAKLPHISFDFLNGYAFPWIPTLMSTPSHCYVDPAFGSADPDDAENVWGPGDEPFMVRGSDAGFIVVHIPIPLFPINLLLPLTILFGSSISLFGASSVKIPSYNMLFPPDEGDITCGIFPYSAINLNVGCNDWCPLPTDFKLTWSDVLVGCSWKDLVAAVIDYGLEVGFAKLGEVGGDKIGKKAKAADDVVSDPAQDAGSKAFKEWQQETPWHKQFKLGKEGTSKLDDAVFDAAKAERVANFKALQRMGADAVPENQIDNIVRAGLKETKGSALRPRLKNWRNWARRGVWNFTEHGFIGVQWGIGLGQDELYGDPIAADQGHPQPTIVPDETELGVQGYTIRCVGEPEENHWSTDAPVVPLIVTFTKDQAWGPAGDLTGFTQKDIHFGEVGVRPQGLRPTVSNFRQSGDSYRYRFELTRTGARDTLHIDEDVCYRKHHEFDLEFPNKAAQPCVIDFTGPLRPPVLTTPVGQATSEGTVTSEPRVPVTARFERNVRGFEPRHVRVSNGTLDEGSFTAVSDREYRFEIVADGPGEVEAEVVEKAGTDGAGRQTAKSARFRILRVEESLAATITRTSPSTAESPIPLRVQFDRPIEKLGADQLLVSGGTLSRITPSGAGGYDLEVMPTAAGQDVRVEIAAGSVSDDLGRTLSNAAELVTRFEPGDGDVLLEEGGQLLTSRVPGLSPEDQETLALGMQILGAA